MSLRSLPFAFCACALLTACAPVTPLATGESVRAWVREQTFDPTASERHGDQAPQGTDPEIANAAVDQLRKPSTQRRTPMRGTSQILKDLVE